MGSSRSQAKILEQILGPKILTQINLTSGEINPTTQS